MWHNKLTGFSNLVFKGNSINFGEFCCTGYNTVHSSENGMLFQQNILPPPSESRNKPHVPLKDWLTFT